MAQQNVIWLQGRHMITHYFVMIIPRYIITWRKRQELIVMKYLLNPNNEKIMVGLHCWHFSHITLVMTGGKHKSRLKMIYFILKFVRVRVILPLKISSLNTKMLMFKCRIFGTFLLITFQPSYICYVSNG